MKKGFAAAFLAVLVVGVCAPPASARGKGDRPTVPGKYTDWGGEIDELEVVQSFKVADYQKIVVLPFDVKDTPLPEKSDNTFEPVTTVLQAPAKPFVDGLSRELGGRLPVSQGESAEGQALVIRVQVVVMDPGSRAARYWGSFGAGAARAGLSGEVVDAATGKTLLRFRQERRSGWGMGGGDYVKLMNKNLRTIGQDVAGILKAF